MHEKLAQSIPVIDEKIDKILVKLFEDLDAKAQATSFKDVTLGGTISHIKELGDALNALATGLDNYRRALRDIADAAKP